VRRREPSPNSLLGRHQAIACAGHTRSRSRRLPTAGRNRRGDPWATDLLEWHWPPERRSRAPPRSW
jgi:hypothetical protein